MSNISAFKDEDKVILERRTSKGEKLTWVARIKGPGKDDFLFDLEFFARPEGSKPKWEKERNGTFTAVDMFDIKPGDILQTGGKGYSDGDKQPTQFFEVGSRGNLIALERRQVHEAFGVAYEERE
jgi:hypothetical protein